MSRRPDAEPVFFIDRCLGGSKMPNALRQAGFIVEIHDDHFPMDEKDENWIPEAAKRNWIILTKDKRIRRRSLEVDALSTPGAATFVLTGKDMNSEQMAEAFICAKPRIMSILRNDDRPLVATVSRTGRIKVEKGARRGGIKRGEPQ